MPDPRPTTRAGRARIVGAPRERTYSPCGSSGAYYRHRQAKEDCQVCKDANNARRRAVRAKSTGNPVGGTRPRVHTPADSACQCECGVVVRNRTALGRHTWKAHDRWPTDRERILLADKAAAA